MTHQPTFAEIAKRHKIAGAKLFEMGTTAEEAAAAFERFTKAL